MNSATLPSFWTDYRWTVRISRGYRAVGILEGNVVTWFWVGNHDAYEIFFSYRFDAQAYTGMKHGPLRENIARVGISLYQRALSNSST